jgi:hypothetical protein
MPLKEIEDPQLFLSLLLLGYEVNGFVVCCHHDMLHHHRPKINGVNRLWTEASQTVSQNRPFLFIS